MESEAGRMITLLPRVLRSDVLCPPAADRQRARVRAGLTAVTVVYDSV